MAPVTFEQGIALEKVSEVRATPTSTVHNSTANTSQNSFRSLQTPWTWHRSTVVPGGILMALAANAAYQTLQPGFSIDTLSCHFLAFPKHDVPFDITVQRLSDGGRFCSRAVSLEQAGVLKVHVTCSFVRSGSMGGPSMTHCIQRRSHQKIESITLDDLAPGRTGIGPYMKYQRLPLLYLDPGPMPSNPRPENFLYTSATQMAPLGSDRDPRIHLLGVIALSDHHILDAPPTVHGLAIAAPQINDKTQTFRPFPFDFMTSLNHSIRFHAHDGFRADEVLYVEAESAWAKGRRAQADTRIFSGEGKLLATCTQEAYFVMKADGEEAEREWVMEGGMVRSKRSKL